MAKVINFYDFINKHAKNQYKVWFFTKEWRTAIIVLIIAKLATNFVSMYSAYNYFYFLLLPLSDNSLFTIIGTIAALLIIEFLTAVFLSKFFKFLLHGRIVIAVFTFIASIGCYYISFISSCNGLAMQQSAKVNITSTISNNTTIEIDNLKKDYEDRIKKIEMEIETIKNNPSEWKNGQRNILSMQQLTDIKKYNEQIAAFRIELKTEINRLNEVKEKQLHENRIETTIEADKYYNVVAVIMIVQLLCNGVLMFFWSVIYKEVTDKAEQITDEVKDLKDTMHETIFETVKNEYVNLQKYLLSLLSMQVKEYEPKKIIASKNQSKKIGFQILKTSDDKNIIPDDTHENSGIIKTDDNRQRICKHCGKSYTYKHNKQIYCCTDCRQTAWENRNNQKLKFKNTKD